MLAIALTALHQHLQVIDLEHALQPLRLRLIETWRAGAGSSMVSAWPTVAKYTAAYMLSWHIV